MTLRWDTIAKTKPADARDPADPAYDWSLFDPILQRLRAAKISLLLSLYGTPGWANGDNPNRVPDSNTTFADFAYAAAKKYSWVRRWTVWNEPNLQLFLRPNTPAVYVSKLLNPAYSALKQANRGNLVAGGVTSPRQTPSGMSPIAWIRGMHAAHARLDAYGQNPYPTRPRETPFTGGCWRCAELTMATLPKLIAEVKKNFGGQDEDLAHRVRLQLEAAESVAGRVERSAGAVCRSGCSARISGAERRCPDPLPRSRRA